MVARTVASRCSSDECILEGVVARQTYAVAMSDGTGSETRSTTAREWLAGFSEVIGAPAPDEDVTEALLDLAGVAAHDSERIAAPIACWMAGVAGVDPAEALERARRHAADRPR